MVSDPVISAAQWPQKALFGASTHFATRGMLQRQNQRLKEDNLLLAAKLQRYLALEQENQQLRGLLNTSQMMDQEMLATQVIALVPAPGQHELIINRGKRHGIRKGLGVLNSSGLIGQTVAVESMTSRVLLLNDVRSAIPVEIERTGVRAIAVGQGDSNHLTLQNVPGTVDITVGDICLTSGIAKRFAPGYPIGRVSRITRSPDKEFATIEVTPMADLNRVRDLLVLLAPKTAPELEASLKGAKHA